MYRRSVLYAAMFLLAARALPADVALAQPPPPDKPTVKLSEVKAAAIRAVEKMSQAAKEHTGVEFSTEQKTEMVDAMISKVQTQGTYIFVDP